MKYRLNFKTLWKLTGTRNDVNKKGETVTLHEFSDSQGNKHEQKLNFELNCPLNTECYVDVDVYKLKNKTTGLWDTIVNIKSAYPKEEN